MATRKAGQEFYVKREADLLPEDRETLRRLGIERSYTPGRITFVDGSGTSFWIRSGRGDVDGFLENGCVVNFETFFELSESGFHAGYVGSKHATRRFPRDFL